jgi:hypothetical protein
MSQLNFRLLKIFVKNGKDGGNYLLFFTTDDNNNVKLS